MGGSGWIYWVKYQSSITKALENLKNKIFKNGEYLETSENTLLYQSFKSNIDLMNSYSTEQILRIYKSDEKFKKVKKMYESLLKRYSSSKSKSINELIKRYGESGTHTILDIKGISAIPKFGHLSPLPDEIKMKLFKTKKPTRRSIEKQITNEIFQTQPRWQGIYLISYKTNKPDEILFIGSSGD